MFYQYESDEHQRKAEEVLMCLGEFVVAFERVCSSMRSCIHIAFRREGLKKPQLSQVLINTFAAEALRTTLGGIFMELSDQDEQDQIEVKSLLTRIDKLGQVRNKLLHAEWFLNYDYDGASEEFFALALKAHSKQTKGATFIDIPVSRKILEEHTKEATEILVLLNRLASSLNQTNLKVSTHMARPL